MSLDLHSIIAFLNIIVIDLTLSGDNAIVIGMAAAALPKHQRKQAVILGGICAIVLRVALTFIASILIRVPYLSLIGGVLLIWIAYKLLALDTGDEHKVKEAGNVRQAITIILAADFMMSLDNVLAVAGSAGESTTLLIIGLLVSMPFLMVSGSLVSMLIDRFKWIVYVGAFAISYTSIKMIFEDNAVKKLIHLPTLLITAICLAIGAFLTAGLTFLAKRRKAKEVPVAGQPS